MVEPVTLPDRRQRRRQESIEEIIDVAVELMAEHGVAGLSLGEVARRLGIRPPSLYVYFASKNALYDAAFARGAREIYDLIETTGQQSLETARSGEAALLHVGSTFIRWAIEHPVYAQLLFWRPVPGFAPTPEAYQPAVALVDLSTELFVSMQERGWLRSDVAAADLLRDWTIVTAGIISQQLSNEPGTDFASGRFTTALPSVVAMYVAANGAAPPASKTSRKSTSSRGTHRAHRR